MVQSTPSDEQHLGDDPRGQVRSLPRIGRTLDEWRARIDELVVQLDLANLDLRDEVRKSVNATQNAYLAAHSKLSDARGDACTSLHTLQQSLEKLLRDLARTFVETQAAVKRSLGD